MPSCDVCGKNFSLEKYLKVHRNIHSYNKAYQCDICDKSFTHQSTLYGHKKIHNKTREVYSCDICEKTFTLKANLKAHMNVHSNGQAFPCNICGKAFSYKKSLDIHIVTHTGEKQYSCSVCNKSFSQKANLITHQKLHLGEKRFVCSVCKKSFSRKENLNRHFRIHSGEKPFSCNNCGRLFSDQSVKINHSKRCFQSANKTAKTLPMFDHFVVGDEVMKGESKQESETNSEVLDDVTVKTKHCQDIANDNVNDRNNDDMIEATNVLDVVKQEVQDDDYFVSELVEQSLEVSEHNLQLDQ